MKLVVGLGNPGAEYERTRHNVGFMVVDELAAARGLGWRSAFKGDLAGRGSDLLFLKPLTYMNCSGGSVRAVAAFFRIDPGDIVAIHDDVDLAFGRVQVKLGGGDAGHKGVRSMAAELGDRNFARVRVGIGRPPRGSVEDFVLTRFNAEESIELSSILTRAAGAVDIVLREGTKAAMAATNRADGGPVGRS